MNNPIQTIIITTDGSGTLLDPKTGEHYHSVHGALQESELVFLENGFRHIAQHRRQLNVLEVGFGTGLNALLTVIEAKKQKLSVNYIAIEPYPIQSQIIEQLNYAEIIGTPEAKGYFAKLHNAGWVYPAYLSDYFIINKIQSTIEDIALKDAQFDLVYFDAFSPEVQPELWKAAVFEKLFRSLKPSGILVTYSTKGIVKRALKSAGFSIEKLPGPAGKREVLRATKDTEPGTEA